MGADYYLFRAHVNIRIGEKQLAQVVIICYYRIQIIVELRIKNTF